MFERRQQQRKQTIINIGWILLALVMLIVVTYGTWRSFMPESERHAGIGGLSDAEQRLAEQLEADVRVMSGEIGERNLSIRGSLPATAGWIEKRMMEAGYRPERMSYEIRSGRFAGGRADNVVAEVRGSERDDKIVIIGAHYDTVYGSPGANDNASAVAVLLALAEWFNDRQQPLTVRFVAFANEEPPFFHSREMGSYAYARRSRELGETITAMISMDGLGYYSDEPGSQHYPLPGIGYFYPDRADFIAFVTRLRDTRLLRRAVGAFREAAAISSEAAALPGYVPGVFWSDHWSFWKHGYPAILVTDTLLFRDPQYHTPADTADRLDFQRMARVTTGMKSVIKELAGSAFPN